MKMFEKTDPELSESPRIKIAKYVAAHKEVSKDVFPSALVRC